MNIFVGSLSFKTTEEELQREFEAFGEVDSVKIILDQETRRSRGFAFVSMPEREQATAAIAGMDGKVVGGFTLKVNEARPREPRGAQPRSGGYNSDRGNSGSGYNRPNSGYEGNRSGSSDGNRAGYDPNRSSGYQGNRTGGYNSNRGGGYDSNRGGGGGGGGYGNDASIYDTKDRSGGRKGRGGHGPGSKPGGGRRPY